MAGYVALTLVIVLALMEHWPTAVWVGGIVGLIFSLVSEPRRD